MITLASPAPFAAPIRLRRLSRVAGIGEAVTVRGQFDMAAQIALHPVHNSRDPTDDRRSAPLPATGARITGRTGRRRRNRTVPVPRLARRDEADSTRGCREGRRSVDSRGLRPRLAIWSAAPVHRRRFPTASLGEGQRPRSRRCTVRRRQGHQRQPPATDCELNWTIDPDHPGYGPPTASGYPARGSGNGRSRTGSMSVGGTVAAAEPRSG